MAVGEPTSYGHSYVVLADYTTLTDYYLKDYGKGPPPEKDLLSVGGLYEVYLPKIIRTQEEALQACIRVAYFVGLQRDYEKMTIGSYMKAYPRIEYVTYKNFMETCHGKQ